MKKLAVVSGLMASLAVVSLAGILLFGSVPVSADASLSNWHKGILVQPTNNSDFASSSFQQSMRNATADGVNDVTLVVPLQQSNIYSTDLSVPSYASTDAALISGIQYIHSLGMQVTLSLHDDPDDGNWRAYINPSDRTTWFNNYSGFLNHYADIAQANGVQEIVIATEMSSMTIPSYNSTNTQNWITVIQSVRGHFSGLLSYGAEHGGYLADDTSLGFWSYLNEIGISAYYGMSSNNASVSDMENTWSQIDNNELKGLAQTYGKPINFIEVGYVSGNNGLTDPGSGYLNPGGYNGQLQANAYQALLAYWSNSSYFDGVSFWDWSTNPNAGGNGDTNYTPQNKPAEQIMKQWFSGGGTVASVPVVSKPTSYSVTSGGGSSTATTNSSTTSTVNASSSQTVNNAIVDVEVYDANGKQVAQKYYENQNLTASPASYQINWTPLTAGSYTVEAGIFTANWQSNLIWNASVMTVVANGPVQTTPPPPTTPAPPTSQPVNPTPTPPVTTPTPPTASPSPTPAPASGSNVDIWWPSNGASVSGVQPFKALIDGVDQNSYVMYWQVDGGQLNIMNTVNDGSTHKEADVDLSGWNWHGNGGRYVINFVAKDNAGNIIGQKSTTITITH